MQTQLTRLRDHLTQGKPITRLHSFIELGICELSSRIGELQRTGFAIDKRWITVTNRYGEKCRVVEYISREHRPQRIKVDLNTKNQTTT